MSVLNRWQVILIEPYRNYKAQLERSYGSQELLEEMTGANGHEQ